MNKRIVTFLMTILSYITVYQLFRFLAERFFGGNSDRGYKRLAASFATLLLTPRFRLVDEEDGEKSIEARWPLLRKYQKVVTLPSRGTKSKEEATEEVAAEEEKTEHPETTEAATGANSDSVPLSES